MQHPSRRAARGRLLVTAAALAIVSSAQAQTPAQTGPRVRIGVLDLSGAALSLQTAASPGGSTTTIAIAPPADFARGLTQLLTTALVGRPEFVVLERAQLDKVIAEQQLGASGAVEPRSAATLGRILGAQALITGDITEFTYNKSSAGSKLSILKSVDSRIGGRLDRVNAQVAIDLRILDATTGAVVSSVRGEGSASATGVQVDFTSFERELGAGGSKSTPLGAASRQAIERAVTGLVEQLRRTPWSGRVADVRGDRVYINAGSDLGIRTGMEFDVYVQGEAVTDPETGATLGTPEQRTGQITVVEVTERFAVGRMTEGNVPKRNDVVRFRGARAVP